MMDNQNLEMGLNCLSALSPFGTRVARGHRSRKLFHDLSQLPFGFVAFWDKASTFKGALLPKFKSQLPFGFVAFWDAMSSSR